MRDSLYYAALDSDLNLVKKLLEKEANPNGEDEQVPLIAAVSIANYDKVSEKTVLEIVKTLVEAGADVNQIETDSFYYPLLVALDNRLHDVSLYLIEQGACYDGNRMWDTLVEVHGDDYEEDQLYALEEELCPQWHPAEVAINAGYIDILKILISNWKEATSLLTVAVKKNSIEIVKYLLSLKSVDVLKANPMTGETILDFIEKDDFYDISSEIVELIKEAVKSKR